MTILNLQEILYSLQDLSFQAMGYSSPNPPVACVITDLEGTIVSKGSTQKTGENHAEREAYTYFAESKKNPHNLFVTLEPCTHFGRTAPCLDLILEYKPKCVYFGLADPNPEVKKRNWMKECENAGIQVIQSEAIAKAAKPFLSGYISKIEKHRPKIFIKSALSKEGYYSDLDKSKISLSNPYSNQITQMFRAKLDAILVGPITVYVDLPGLDFRGFDMDLLNVENSENIKMELNSNEEMQNPFTKLIFESIVNPNTLVYHSSKLLDYQPYRVFVMSLKRSPDTGFFQKQHLLNEKYKSKKAIFFLLDFDTENVSHKKIYTKVEEISFISPVIIKDKSELMETLFSKFSELSFNTILVEGGNLLYKNFSENLCENDSLYFIRTEKTLTNGILPEIDLKNREMNVCIKMDSDLWEVYGE